MADDSTLFEGLGLPVLDDAARARARTRERMADLVRQGQVPWPSKVQRPRSPSEELSQCTGLLTHADIFGTTPCLEGWADEHYPDLDSEREEDEPEEDWDVPWWIVGPIGGGLIVWELLDRPVGFGSGEISWEFDGFEIDGIPWTVETLYKPGPPLAARVGEMTLHGGKALPGPGSLDVYIGGQRALTVAHSVATCERTTTLGVPHAPQPKAWTTTNTSVVVNGELLLRAGDCVLESPGGPNPLVSGMPTVFVGPPANPVMVQEEGYVGLDFFIDDLEHVGWSGGEITLEASVSWTYQDAAKGLAAIGLFHLGAANPMVAPVTTWGARSILASMNKPEIKLRFEVEGGTVIADTREDYVTVGPGGVKHRTKRERWEFDLWDFFDERSAEVDPAKPFPPIKKDEKSGTKTTPIDKETTRIDEDEIEVGPFRKKSQTHDADEAPKDWDE
ncbi:MAG: hypothetical protein ACRBN8_43845 [Nannocystales bacterium]